MGLFDKIKQNLVEAKQKKLEEKSPAVPAGKYPEPCALCGGNGADKKYLGQFWHKKCLRGVKKQSKKMI